MLVLKLIYISKRASGGKVLTSKTGIFLTQTSTHWGQDKMATISQMTFTHCIFLNDNILISIDILWKFVPDGHI